MDNHDFLRDIAFRYQRKIDEKMEFQDQAYFLNLVLAVGSNEDRINTPIGGALDARLLPNPQVGAP